MASNGGRSPHVQAALDWAQLQAVEWDRLREESFVAQARDYYEAAARHLRLLATIAAEESE